MMAFVASTILTIPAGVIFVPMPLITDASLSGFTYGRYTHMRVPGGAQYIFDNGQSYTIPASTDTIIAIPAGARNIAATAATTAQLGRSM